jgi:hypothetical protein
MNPVTCRLRQKPNFLTAAFGEHGVRRLSANSRRSSAKKLKGGMTGIKVEQT